MNKYKTGMNLKIVPFLLASLMAEPHRLIPFTIRTAQNSTLILKRYMVFSSDKNYATLGENRGGSDWQEGYISMACQAVMLSAQDLAFMLA